MSSLDPPNNSSADSESPLDILYALLAESIEAEEATPSNKESKEATKAKSPPIPKQESNSAIAKPSKPQESLEQNHSEESQKQLEENHSNPEVKPTSQKPSEENRHKYTKALQNKSSTPSLLDEFDKAEREQIARLYVSQQWIVAKEKQIEALADKIDGLLPLVVQLAQSQTDNTEEYILKTIVPVIDRVIKERSAQDSGIMSDAIANLLPNAITQEITNEPQLIGKAIAPELALSIVEQIKLDENAIADALGTEMGKAIKTQIEVERDAMVDALYPVIGSTISKYMAEVVESIEQKVDNALSPEGIKRKIRAKMQGVSEAELIFRESFPYRIRAVFLIQKASGLVIAESQSESDLPLESDLLAGMLTAIRSFAHDCIVSASELDEISYDRFEILFETAGYCYLAVVVDGEPDREFRERMRTIFSSVVTRYGKEIESYQGDKTTIPLSLSRLLSELIQQQPQQQTKGSSNALYWLIGLMTASILIPWGILRYRSVTATRIERSALTILDRTPELSVYRLTPEVKKGSLTLNGRVPSENLRSLAANKVQALIAEKQLKLNNEIVAVDVPVEPEIVRGEVARITKLLNQKDSVSIESQYQNRTVSVSGSIADNQEKQNIVETFSSIPGVRNVIVSSERQLPNLVLQLYFPSGAADIANADESKLGIVADFLAQYPHIGLKLIGHSDNIGNREDNLKLARDRANNVGGQLISLGIAPDRLEAIATLELPPDVTAKDPLWLSRSVRFESFLLSNK